MTPGIQNGTGRQVPPAQAVPPDVRQQLVSARAMALEVLVEEEVLGTTTIA